MELNLLKNFPQALSKGVIVLPHDEAETKTAGGLIIPDVVSGSQTEQRKPAIAIICDVGVECTMTVRDVATGERRVIQKGDKIGHSPYADSGFMFGSNWYLQMSELDIKVFYPDNEARPYVKEVPSRKRAAVQKAQKKYQ